jgi:hypothetical protein
MDLWCFTKTLGHGSNAGTGKSDLSALPEWFLSCNGSYPARHFLALHMGQIIERLANPQYTDLDNAKKV